MNVIDVAKYYVKVEILKQGGDRNNSFCFEGNIGIINKDDFNHMVVDASINDERKRLLSE